MARRPLLWEQQPGEPHDEYQMFTKFLGLMPPRNRRDLLKISDYTYQKIADWSAKYRWGERAVAYDTFLWKKQVMVTVNTQAAAQEQQIKAFYLARQVATKRVQKLAEKIKHNENAVFEMSLDQALKYLVETTKMERLIHGDATERIEKKYLGSEDRTVKIDFSILSPEELDRLSDVIPLLEKVGLISDKTDAPQDYIDMPLLEGESDAD